ncbi:LPXTG cell wall anchor domain-containing protein [Bacillus sp. NEB1478]|uniref:LPXTG cell wall anchor domain-containing protein n=1 Tax=Bacillus sp. NEB1478 TaxID=3073816 RepID=UPI002872BD64|nr:LPXTG cell wall anchor domain-containing protein [Bacillus sp. NEB1478]WNB92487.1 LPXTG cell wall anchor domain-containing protein [Bacillus sp. NEB1478]
MFNKKKLKRIVFGLIPAFLVSTFMVHPDKIYSFNEDQYRIEINPASFNFQNMRPGYVENYTLTVTNTGNQAIKYKIKSENISGESLYNQLNLTVMQQNEELYDGKLSDLTIDSRNLSAHKHEDLTFSIGLTEEAGNEFQDAATSFKFQVQGEGEDSDDGGTPGDGGGDDGGNPPGDDGSNPGTPGNDDGNNTPGQKPPSKGDSGTPGNNSGKLPQTGEENPMAMILSGLFISLAGLGLLLVRKNTNSKSFKRG